MSVGPRAGKFNIVTNDLEKFMIFSNNLEKSTNSLLNWFRENHIKANADKCPLLVSSDQSCTAKIEDFSIKNGTEETLLGAKFDSNLSFESHITSLCKKASQKLHAVARISH